MHLVSKDGFEIQYHRQFPSKGQVSDLHLH